MLSFLKRKQSGPEIGLEFYRHYKKAVPRGFKFQKIIHASTAIDSNAVEMSGFILQIFALIFGLFSLGQDAGESGCIDAFWHTSSMAPTDRLQHSERFRLLAKVLGLSSELSNARTQDCYDGCRDTAPQ